MIEQITFGILGVTFGLGAFLSARRMAKGPVHYYGQTSSTKSRSVATETHAAAKPKLTIAEVRDLLVSQPELVAEALKVLGIPAAKSFEDVARRELERAREFIVDSSTIVRLRQSKDPIILVEGPTDTPGTRAVWKTEWVTAECKMVVKDVVVKDVVTTKIHSGLRSLRERSAIEGHLTVVTVSDNLERRVRALEERFSSPNVEGEEPSERVPSQRIN